MGQITGNDKDFPTIKQVNDTLSSVGGTTPKENILRVNLLDIINNSGKITDNEIIEDVENSIKKRMSTMQNTKNARFSNIAKIFLTLLIRFLSVELVYDKP